MSPHITTTVSPRLASMTVRMPRFCRFCREAPVALGDYCGVECRAAQWREYDRQDREASARAAEVTR